MAQAATANHNTFVSELCKELGVKPVILYRYVDHNGNLRDYGKRALGGLNVLSCTQPESTPYSTC